MIKVLSKNDITSIVSLYQSFFNKHYPEKFKSGKRLSDLQNHFFFKTWALFDNENLLALCSSFQNPDLSYDGKPVLCLGYYECISDLNPAQKLLDVISEEAKRLGYEQIIGPLNGSTWYEYRFTDTVSADLFFTENYHLPYYANHFQALGFDKLASYSSKLDNKLQELSQQKTEQIASFWLNKPLKIRNLNPMNYREEISKIHDFTLTAFANNFLYTPIGKQAFLEKYLPIQNYLDFDLIFLADLNDEIIGLLFTIPDLMNPDQLIVKTIAKKPGRSSAGVTHLLGQRLIERAKQKGYKTMIHAFMHEANASANVSQVFSGETIRTYSLWKKIIA